MRTFAHTYWPHLFGVAVALVVGIPAAVASYRHGITVVETHSTDPAMAPWLPMTTDGLLLASLVALWARRMTGRAIGVGPWSAFGLGLVATLLTNFGAAKLTPWGIGVALWPPLCLAIVLELVALIVVPDRGRTSPLEDRQPEVTPPPVKLVTEVAELPPTNHQPTTTSHHQPAAIPAVATNHQPTARDLVVAGAGRTRLMKELGLTDHQARTAIATYREPTNGKAVA